MTEVKKPTEQTAELQPGASLAELAAKVTSRDPDDMYRPRTDAQKINYLGLLIQLLAAAIEELRRQVGGQPACDPPKAG